MPERLDVEVVRSRSIEDIHCFLAGLRGSESIGQLPSEFISQFSHAWRVPVDFGKRSYNFLVLLDGNFPFSLPRIAIEDGPKLLDWPHLERNGLLCVVPSMASGSHREIRRVVQHILAAACRLIEHNIRGDTEQELREEFLSYWSYACDPGAHSCVSIVAPKGPSREIVVSNIMSASYFADDNETLNAWINNFLSTNTTYETDAAWLVWRDRPWIPTEYPASAADLLGLIRENRDLLPIDRIAAQSKEGFAVLVGAPTDYGVCFAALRHAPPTRTRQDKKRHSGDPLIKGFRPGRVPKNIQLSRAFSVGARLVKNTVSRADAAWIHGRDQDEQQQLLQDRQVVVVGSGSLGSEIITLLAKSGVGHFTAVDGQSLEWANISRHSLGAAAVDANKASGMARFIRETLPHVRIVDKGHAFTLKDKELILSLMDCDLLVSATGDWSAAALLNALWLDTSKSPQMIVTWMEAHALASHSVHFSNETTLGCLQCGFSETGTPRLEVASWDANPTRRLPACGGVFMPYGPIGLSRAAALTAEHCVDVLSGRRHVRNHRIWIGLKEHLYNAGGTWSEQWLSEMGDPGSGGLQTERQWERDVDCPECRIPAC